MYASCLVPSFSACHHCALLRKAVEPWLLYWDGPCCNQNASRMDASSRIMTQNNNVLVKSAVDYLNCKLLIWLFKRVQGRENGNAVKVERVFVCFHIWYVNIYRRSVIEVSSIWVQSSLKHSKKLVNSNTVLLLKFKLEMLLKQFMFFKPREVL